jgi:hypothetical protein
MPNVSSIIKAIQKAAVSNEAKKRLIQAANKKVTQKDIKELIRTEMRTGAPKLGRAVRRPDVANAPKRVVERRGQTGPRAPKVDPAKELYDIYKPRIKPDTKTVTKSYQKDRVTPADVLAKRAAAKRAAIIRGTSPKATKGKRVTPATPARPGAGKASVKRELKAMREEMKRAEAARKRLLAKGERLKKVNPKDREMDASRRAALRNAGEDPRNTLTQSRPTIASREPARNPDTPSRNELAAFGQLSKREQKAYREIESRITEALKKIRDLERGKTPRKNSPTRGKKTK